MGAATTHALAFPQGWTVYCPNKDCPNMQPIRTDTGEVVWERFPDVVTCPDCGGRFKVKPAVGGRKRQGDAVKNGEPS